MPLLSKGSSDLNAISVLGAEYSTTNVQVSNVDETDIVKTDSKYIYVISKNTVFIIEAYSPEGMKRLSEIRVEGNPISLFINKN